MKKKIIASYLSMYPFKHMMDDDVIMLQEFLDNGGDFRLTLECGREMDKHPAVVDYLRECEEKVKKSVKDRYEKIHKHKRRGKVG